MMKRISLRALDTWFCNYEDERDGERVLVLEVGGDITRPCQKPDVEIIVTKNQAEFAAQVIGNWAKAAREFGEKETP